jgi:hypothetical protein
MNKTIWLAMCAVLAGSAHAQSSWLSESDSTIEQARSAKRNNVAPADATSEMIGLGRDPAQIVQSVVQTYGNCEALQASVETGSRMAPTSAQAIVEAVNALPCVCAADTIWPHMRLQGRIRVENPRMAVEVGAGSMCAAAAAEAAVRGAPEMASDVLRGAISAGRRGGSVLDSVGQVGAAPKSVAMQENLSRDLAKNQGCDVDTKIDDAFDPSEKFQDRAAAGEIVQQRQEKCDRMTDLFIDGVASAQSSNTAVVLRNDTGGAIDLDRGGYAIEVYFAGSNVPGRKIALEGSINPGNSFIVASPDAEGGVLQQANLVTPSVRVSPGDSVVLRRGSSITDCRGVSTATAVIANTLGDSQGKSWLDQVASEYADERAMKTVDAVGQAGEQPEAWQGTMAGKALSVSRSGGGCEGDTMLVDPFQVAGAWQASDTVNPSELGSANRCAQRTSDLVISKYANDADQYRAVELVNNSSGDVDLAAGGYMLEVYAEGATEPSRTVALEGVLKAGDSFVIADDQAPAEVKERARLVSSDLALSRINALALRKMSAMGGRACAAQVAAVVRDIDAIPVGLVMQNPIVPSREPRADDEVDGNRGGILASPN